MYEKFDIKEYHVFLKKIYSRCDRVEAEFDTVITDLSSLKTGKFSSIYNNIMDAAIHYDNGYPYADNGCPYTSVKLKKDYRLYSFLNAIDNWESFSEDDIESEYRMEAISFYCGDDCIGAIVSHYRAYNNYFGIIEPD